MSVEFPKRLQAEKAMRRQWFPVARSADLSTPQSAVLLGERLVVYRTAAGKAVVQSARCPHRGADFALGKVHDDSIACPYHGWRFAADNGRCVHVPSLEDQSKVPPRASIHTYPCVERFAHVWTALEEPATDMYDPAAWRGLEWEWLAGPTLDSETGVAVAMENFRDVAHFPFVHAVSMGPSPTIVEPLQVRREGIDVWMDRPLIAGEGDWAKDGGCMMYYHCTAPGFASITYDYERLGKRIVTGFPSPAAYDHVRIFWGVANERGYKGAGLEECLRVEEMVYREDMPIAAGIRPREIDWDGVFLEYSVPADVFTLNYRRAFREFVRRTEPSADSTEDRAQA